MTRGQHHVLHSGLPGDAHPLFGRLRVGREMVGEPGVLALGNPFAEAHPFAAASHGIQAEMNEHAEDDPMDAGEVTTAPAPG
jgi:hypothetical protein